MTYRSLLDHLQFDDVTWRPYQEHREIQVFFLEIYGIQAGLCAVLLRCTVTCLRELGGSTDTSRTSLDIQGMLLSCDRIRLCRHSLTSALTRLRSLIGVSR